MSSVSFAPPSSAEIDCALEALLLVSKEVLSPARLAELMAVDEDAVLAGMRRLQRRYAKRGIRIEKHAGAYRFAVALNTWRVVDAYRTQPAELSEEAYETLALIAYLQPISLETLFAYRGADAGHVLETLQKAGLIQSRLSDAGEPIFVTTDRFIESIGLASLDDLPAVDLAII